MYGCMYIQRGDAEDVGVAVVSWGDGVVIENFMNLRGCRYPVRTKIFPLSDVGFRRSHRRGSSSLALLSQSSRAQREYMFWATLNDSTRLDSTHLESRLGRWNVAIAAVVE